MFRNHCRAEKYYNLCDVELSLHRTLFCNYLFISAINLSLDELDVIQQISPGLT